MSEMNLNVERKLNLNGACVVRGGLWQALLLTLRLIELAVVVTLLTLHMRSLRVFRWERMVSGGAVIFAAVAALGLALCAGTEDCKSEALQGWLSAVSGVLLALNAVMLWRRWRNAGELTRVVAELLGALGLPVRRQLAIKIILSASAAVLFLADLAFAPLQRQTTALLPR